ncbi:histone-lysine N-methyltransferase ASHR2 [Senna tora]|uniref:Histone-lysine N-methyltransferase ASHR2 n=1 Tax=Senna tora TaxID=362788 RepID=A0A834TXQ2_9FABA|nr:histone-lysine N-methyltransferase ASHR2 [Senna tora]
MAMAMLVAASGSLIKMDPGVVLKMAQIEGKGRGLIASQNLKAGQVILTEPPTLLYSAFPLLSQSQSQSSYCDHCFRILPLNHTAFSCPSCSHHRFCSHNCLSIALKSSHSPWVCHALSRLRHSASPLLEQSHQLQVQARFVVAANNLASRSPSDIQILLSLLGTPDEGILKASQFLHSLIASLCPPQHQLSVHLTAQLMAIDRLNNFSLMEPYSPHGPERCVKAYAIYPKVTMFNHSCLPDVCRFDYFDTGAPGDEHNTDIVIRMIKDVSEGEEICISYLRFNKDYATRKRILMDEYGFDCECDRCKVEANWVGDRDGDFPHAWFLSKYVCDRNNCSGTMVPLLPKDDDAPSNILECSFLKMEQIQGKGRGLIAAHNLKAGQILLTESPTLLYSAFPLFSQSSSSSYCDHCFRISPLNHTTFACPSCHHHRFCSQDCLSIALNSSHSPWVCLALSRLRDSASPLLQQSHELQVQARFVVAVYNLASYSPSDIQILLSLLGTPDEAILKASQFLHSLVASLCPPQHQLSLDLTAQLMAKDRLNSFCLMEPYSPDGPQRSIKAYAIYPKATFFNHDCLPNACRFDYVDTSAPGDEHNTDIVIRMIKDVSEGEEICISYFRINRDYATRKRILMEDYRFVCECDRCKIEANWVGDGDFPHAWFLSKYVCDRNNCSGTMAPLPPKDDDTPSNILECNFCGNLKDEVA